LGSSLVVYGFFSYLSSSFFGSIFLILFSLGILGKGLSSYIPSSIPFGPVSLSIFYIFLFKVYSFFLASEISASNLESFLLFS